MGNGTVIRPHELQRMSAGSAVRHSEFNAYGEEAVHLLQIWIQPSTQGIGPGDEQRVFPLAGKRNRMRLIASPGGDLCSVHIEQNVRIFAAVLDA